MDKSRINLKVFKPYDIRGVYPDDLNEETAFAIGKILANSLPLGIVVVGRDMRVSSPQIFEAVVNGLVDGGREIHDIGLVPIDAVYFAVNKFDYAGGVMVTASHNPKEYNGMKIVERGMKWVRGKDLLELVGAVDFDKKKERRGINSFDIWPTYIEHLFSFIDIAKIRKLKIVVDAGNGMAGKVMPILASRLPVEIIPLFFELDGNFPNHPSNPLEPQSQVAIIQKVVEVGADFGVIFDGDTDRLFFVDEKGNFIRADITLLLLAKLMLEREPGTGIAYNVVCSKIVKEKVEEWGGRAIRSAVGFVNVAKASRENNGIMGGEISAHYSFRDNGYADSGFIAFLILLQLISETNKPLSEMVAPFQKYFKSDEMNFRVDDVGVLIQKIKANYQTGTQDELDGLTVEYSDWWFNARPSNTEPLLRITIEANTREVLEQKRNELETLIKS